jgi:hypothetical protein
MKSLLILLAAACLTACSTTAILTPVSGPAVGSHPITAEIKGIMGNSGDLTFTLPSGERVAGQWVAVRRGNSGTNGAGTAQGDRGTVFDIEFECDMSAHGIGKATDNRGNTYRVLVRGV